MRAFLQNLLVFFSLGLCALISFQWVRETDLQKSVQSLTDTIHDKAEAIQNLQVNVKRDEGEIQRLDGIKTQLTQTLKSNDVQIASLTRDLDKANVETERAQKQIEMYKTAIETANKNIKQQNDSINRQNEEMQKLADDRNEIVKKFNKIATDYKELVERWNSQQEELRKAAATNAPPVKK